ncbi:tyrosine-type recombinase/integrase [Mammaliicoccus fleurettii]|nr:tyrosine-type recombinase/integrase [Mammaliicoccus fleurettii]
MVVDDEQKPIEPILLYMKYLDSIQKSPNTQRTYCYGLRDFFLYLKLINVQYKDVKLSTLANFLTWLVNPSILNKVQHITYPRLKSEKTINLRMTTILAFYKFLFQFEYISEDITQNSYIKVKNVRSYKDFLYHINKGKALSKNILKIKEPKSVVKTIPDEVINNAFRQTKNPRDIFLLCLLYETGLRIGEVLSLYKEDITFDIANGHKLHIKNRNPHLNDARLKTGERTIFISIDLVDLFDDYMYDIIDFDNSPYMFIKLKGQNKGQKMSYYDICSLFKRISQIVDYHLYPHLFRHTHATKYFNQTKNIKSVQERLGHRHIQTTMELYLHPSEEEKREQWLKAQEAFKMEGY